MVDYNKRAAIWNPGQDNMGVAYAVVDVENASIHDIGSVVVDVAEKDEEHEGRSSPGALEIALVETKDFTEAQNPELHYFLNEYSTRPIGAKSDVKPKKLLDQKYLLQVGRPGKTNAEMANYLTRVMNHVDGYYGEGKPFNASVIYKDPEEDFLDFVRD